eukprot:626984-Prorocentrum_minimum.AAC.1
MPTTSGRVPSLCLPRRLGFKQGAVQWVPVSGAEGQNLWAPPEGAAARMTEWGGSESPLVTLVGAVERLTPPARATHRPLRLPVAEVIGKGGAGSRSTLGAVAVAGKIEGGVVRPGMRVLLLPGDQVSP